MKKKFISCITIFVIFAASILALTGCKDNEKEKVASPLVGAWVSCIDNAVMGTEVYAFKDNNKGKLLIIGDEVDIDELDSKNISFLEEVADAVIPFTYTDNGESFDYTYEYEGEKYTVNAKYSIDGDKLKLNIEQAGHTYMEYKKF